MIVIIESPYAGDTETNTAYARDCMLDSIRRGESPFASHLLYTQVLDETADRETGLKAAEPFYRICDLVAVYTDYWISPGMRVGIELATKYGRKIEYRSLVK